MANSYHDAQGKFCSKNEMRKAFEDLASQGNLEGYFKLRTEYEEISKDMKPFEELISVNGTSSRKTAPKPIITDMNPLHEPSISGALDLYNFSYEYESYGPPNGQERAEYNKNYVYGGLKLTEIPPVKQTLASIFSCEPNDIPDELEKYAVEQLEMNDFDSYEIYGRSGYYGEEIAISYSGAHSLRKWYYGQENARDVDGVLDYVRSKGQKTGTKKPINAVKAQLASENGGKVPAAVSATNKVSIKKLSAKQIVVPDSDKLASSATAPIESKNGTARSFAGVVVKREDDTYVLVDGYKRYKTMEANKGQKEYIVLEHSKYNGFY